MTQTLEKEVAREVIPSDLKLLVAEQRELLQKLDSFEAPYLEEKLLVDGKFSSPAEYQEAFTEFKKYAALVQLSEDTGLAMISPKVDEVWHQFILFTKEYTTFCQNILGRFLHHVPNTTYTPLSEGGRARFIEKYRQTFGELPSLWEMNSGSDPCDACGPAACTADDCFSGK